MKRLNQLLLAFGLTLASGSSLMGVTSTWDGDTDSYWSNPFNWDIPPIAGNDILFPNVANQSVDLNSAAYVIGSLSFNAPDAYSLANGVSPGLTLGGDVSQNGAGTVAVNVDIDLGGANRNFGGSGPGVVTLNNPVTDTTALGYRALVNGGDYVIANNGNTIDGWQMLTGGKATMVGSSTTIPTYPTASYFGGNGAAGGFYLRLNGGTLNFQVTETINMAWGIGQTALGSADWQDRAIVYGPNGGTLVYDSITAGWNGPTVYYGQGGLGTLVVGQPLPYSGDPWAPDVGAPTDGTNQYRSPFEVEYGIPLGIYQNSSYTYPGSTLYYKWRQGSGDFQLILTNGGSAYLDWNVMTNGNFIVRGHPGGDSSVIETNATGWTRNVGRLAIRGPHRAGGQYSSTTVAGAPWGPGVIDRSFYMDQPYGMVFYDAVQVWNRDGMERLACDMSFESGSSVDFNSGTRSQFLDLGHPGNAVFGSGPTNVITIKNGGKLNLNLQMRSQVGDGRRSPRGNSAGLRVWSFVDIKDGGQLKIYRSQNSCFGLTEVAAGDTGGSSSRAATKCIELFHPIIGSGSSASDAKLVIDLPWSRKSNLQKSGGSSDGIDGVNWEANPASMGGSYPGALPIVNGSGDYGLRVEGKAAYLTNFLYTLRTGSPGSPNALAGLTGTGGTFTVAVTDGETIDISNGPSSSANVALAIASGSNPKYVLGPDGSMYNFNGLVHKGGTAVVRDGTTVTMKTLKLAAADATIQLGDAAGSGAVLNFDNSSAVAWAGTLTISNWNGSLTGGGPDQIKFGTDATGLTAGQLAQIKWVAPNGDADVTAASILASGEIVPYVAPADTEITSPAIVNGEFVFNVVPGVPTQTSVIQMATNLTPPVYWENVKTNTGAFSFTNSIALPESYFRVLVP